MLCTIALAALLAAPLVARDTTFKGTVAKVDKTSVEITTGEGAAKKTVAFAVTDKTKVMRAGAAVAFDAAAIKVGEGLAITVAKGDEAKTDFTCSMHPEVSEAAAGKCAKCGMTLKQRTVPAKAATIQLGGK
jgi:hypothetical protein